MAASTGKPVLPPISTATAGVIRRLGEEMAEAGDPQIAAHTRIGQVTAIDSATITATVAYGAGTNLVAIGGHHWLDGQQPTVNDYVMVLSQDGDNWIVGKMATSMGSLAYPVGARVRRDTDWTNGLADNSDVAVPWTVSVRDDIGMWSGSGSTDLTVPTGYAGWWLLGTDVQYSGNVSGAVLPSRRVTSVKVNGTSVARQEYRESTSNSKIYEASTATARYLADGDVITGCGFQNSGAAMTAQNQNEAYPLLWAIRLAGKTT